MRNRMRATFLCLLIAVATLPSAFAVPWIENAKMVTQPVSGSLARTIDDLARGQNVWVAYAVARLPGHDDGPCCHDWSGSKAKCRLDDTSMSFNDDKRPDATVDRELRVLLRLDDRRIDRVRIFGGHCAIDAGGAKILLLEGVDPQDSVELLAGLVPRDEDLADEALAALAFHAEPSAGRALLKFTDASSPDWARAKAAFWLGSTRGEESLDRLQQMARKDPSGHVREQAIFAVSISDAPGAEDVLIDIARRDPRPDMRSKALFWLAQEAGQRIPETIKDAVDDDPNVEVKEQAVFALSQLPRDRGIPLLIEIARSADRHPSVRRAAMFWLGQSGDPRALEFFEEVLK
jgi:HEAT repeats